MDSEEGHNPSIISFFSMQSLTRRAAWMTPFFAGILLGVLGTAGAATLRGSDVFPDVRFGTYYDEAIGDMYDLGVIKGYDNGTFGPDDVVTRGQLAVMLQRMRDELTGNVRSSVRSSSSRSTSSSASSVSSVWNPKGTIRFTAATMKVPENVATKKITVAVVRTAGNEGTVTIEYETSDGSATEGSDYTKSSGTLTFANKETSKTFDIAIKDDSASEGDETLTITLKNPGNGVSLGVPATATLTITDDESGGGSSSSKASSSTSSTGPTVGFGATQYSVNEDMGTIAITVVRGGSTSGNASVAYATSNGTAKSGTAYTSVSGTLNFSSGETSKTFSVPIMDDSSTNGARAFTVTLSNPTGAALAADLGTATVTINDDESVAFGSGAFKFSRSNYSVLESSGKAVITVQRTGGSIFAASVNYATTSLSASGGADFTHTSGTLSFAAGEAAKIITIPILKDDLSDSGETFAVELSSPTGNVPLIEPYSAQVTIE